MRLCTVIRTPTGVPTYTSDVLIECGSHANEVTKEPERANERERDRVVSRSPDPLPASCLHFILRKRQRLSSAVLRNRGKGLATRDYIDRVDASVGFAPRPIKWLLRNMAGKVHILPLCNSGVLSTGTMRRRATRELPLRSSRLSPTCDSCEGRVC